MQWVVAAGAKLGDRYVLEAKVGEGGMGQVWRARHIALENEVAIKFLSGSLAENDDTRKRFLMEAKLTAQLRSRNAVQVFDFGVTEDGHPYLVMELLHGETLAQRIARLGKLDLRSTVRIMSSAAKALRRAHALGIIHRDFKPDNVFLTETEEKEEEVKVVDFGIAKLLGSLDEAPPTSTDFAESKKLLTSLTRTGKLVGTPNYMSPEQIAMAGDLDARVDVWAFGIVAYECVTGRSPFDGNDVLSLFADISLGRSRLASDVNPDVPAAFDAWFKIACASDPAKRFAEAHLAAEGLAEALGDVHDFADESTVTGVLPARAVSSGSAVDDPARTPTLLASSADASPVAKPRSPVRLILAGVAAVSLVGAALFFFARSTPRETAEVRSPHETTAAKSADRAPPLVVEPASVSSPSPSALASVAPVASVSPRASHASGSPPRRDKPPPPVASAEPHVAAPPPSAPPSPPPAGAPSPFALPPLGL